MSQAVHAFSVDVEDWYQGIEIPIKEWGNYESRVVASMTRLMDLMARRDVTCTCFVLGKVAEDHPQLVRDIHQAGHEVATHGFAHEEVFRLTPEQFRDDIKRSLDAIQSAVDGPVIGYRAPFFTITKDSLWALDILAEEGILYDSSIHPVRHFRYGIPSADRVPSVISLESGRSILELPVSTLPMGSFNLPVGGGAYFRLYPYSVQRKFLRKLEAKGEVVRMYTHPWEIDEAHPRIDLPRRLKTVHYTNLRSTFGRLDRLFSDFAFRPYRQVYETNLLNRTTDAAS